MIGKLHELEGGFIESEQTFESQRPEVERMIEARLGTSANPTPYAKSVWADAMNQSSRVLTDENMAEIKDYIVSQVANKYDETLKIKQIYDPQTRIGAGERIKLEDAASFFTLTNLASQGDESALAQLSGTLTLEDGTKVSGRFTNTPDAIVFTETTTGEVTEIPKNLSQEEMARRIGAIIRPRDTPDVREALYERGRRVTEGQFGVARPTPEAERIEVTTFDLTPIDRLKGGGETAVVRTLRGLYGRDNPDISKAEEFKFSEARIGQDAVKIVAPGGQQQTFDTDNTKAIKDFIAKYSLGKRPEFVPPPPTGGTYDDL